MKEIYIEKNREVRKIVIKENNLITYCFIEEDSVGPHVGQIYIGMVENIVPAIKCAFIDIGFKKKCYMYLDKKFRNTKLKKGEYVIVEVLKEELGTKGAKVTNAFSIPGRLIALETLNNDIQFSKKIHDTKFIDSIKRNIFKPKGIGIMLRTKSQFSSIEEINGEITKLYSVYEDIIRKGSFLLKPALLFSDEGILDRVLRDLVDLTISVIFTNDQEDFSYINKYIEENIHTAIKLELYENKRSMFDYFNIEMEILKLLNKKVDMKSGGYLYIEKTEAMNVIDVNSGKSINNKSISETAFKVNKEAAYEISRQIKLRNLSGIIVIDFIDMVEENEKDEVLSILKECFKDDKCKTVIFPFTQLNIVQIARNRKGKSINEYFEEKCPLCEGNGRQLRFIMVKEIIRNDLSKLLLGLAKKHVFIQINIRYKSFIMENLLNFIEEIGAANEVVYIDFQERISKVKVSLINSSKDVENALKYRLYG